MKYKLFLVAAFLMFLSWAAYKPLFPNDWWLENYLVFLYVPGIFILGRYFKLSNISYTLITAFVCLHLIGSHYTYAEVPLGNTLGDWVGSNRNMYDRIVHLSFGLLLAYPIREVFMQITETKGFWSYLLPINLIFSFSSIYEILEWWTVLNVSPELGFAFLGAQGDIWDTQKDMTSAGTGAIITMIIVFLIHASHNKNAWKEIKESFRIK